MPLLPKAGEIAMADTSVKPRATTVLKTAKPPLHKVILLNDDYTPREFVVRLLKAEFRVPEAQALGIMLTAHTKGACVVAVFTREIAEEKATRATNFAKQNGYPLLFTTEPEE
jgi:ATP-dependent Clp protease adaptor protein ClpS